MIFIVNDYKQLEIPEVPFLVFLLSSKPSIDRTMSSDHHCFSYNVEFIGSSGMSCTLLQTLLCVLGSCLPWYYFLILYIIIFVNTSCSQALLLRDFGLKWISSRKFFKPQCLLYLEIPEDFLILATCFVVNNTHTKMAPSCQRRSFHISIQPCHHPSTLFCRGIRDVPGLLHKHFFYSFFSLFLSFEENCDCQWCGQLHWKENH